MTRISEAQKKLKKARRDKAFAAKRRSEIKRMKDNKPGMADRVKDLYREYDLSFEEAKDREREALEMLEALV